MSRPSSRSRADSRQAILRIVRSGSLHPALNMAIDEALLVAGGPPTLRLYGWSPPGLSIGYFQESSTFQEMAGDHVLVRRPTGGGAIYHRDELTFALTLDTALLPGSLADSYRVIHDAAAAALDRIGVTVRRAVDGVSTEQPAPWCFANPCPSDLVDSSLRKILGSAQRRIRRPHPRTLNHGSIVIRRPEVTPFCAAVEDQANPNAVVSDLEEYLTSEIASGLALHPQPGEATREELDLARQLMGCRYGNAAFTHRR